MRWLLLLLPLVAGAQECTPDSAAPHAPTTVIYDYVEGVERASLLTITHDGSVRAIDATTTEPLWMFTPPEVVTRAMLTDLRVLRFDANGDGTIDTGTGDRVWLYFGLGDAGSAYYALDITERTRAKVLWRKEVSALAMSTPTIARVRVTGTTQNGERFALVVGDGKTVRLLDAADGHPLWEAKTDNEVLAGVTPVDTDGDAYADHFYAVDVTGDVLRFDLAALKVIAHLRAATSDERFLNTPDVAFMHSYYAIAVGSDERFYALRDHGALVEPAWTIDSGRVLGASVTVNGVVMFTACAVSATTTVYAIRVEDAHAAVDLNNDGKISEADVSAPVRGLTEPAVIRVHMGSIPKKPGEPAMPSMPECSVGPIVLESCVTATALVRTYWRTRSTR